MIVRFLALGLMLCFVSIIACVTVAPARAGLLYSAPSVPVTVEMRGRSNFLEVGWSLLTGQAVLEGDIGRLRVDACGFADSDDLIDQVRAGQDTFEWINANFIATRKGLSGFLEYYEGYSDVYCRVVVSNGKILTDDIAELPGPDELFSSYYECWHTDESDVPDLEFSCLTEDISTIQLSGQLFGP